MNYRHIYHAGNFGDVVKHAVLTLLLRRLMLKDSALCVLDTHAGIGTYNLASGQALKTGEFRSGIGALMKAGSLPEPLTPYLGAVRQCGCSADSETDTGWYPGSPWIARHFLRPGDRLVLSELHTDDIQTLRDTFAGDRQVSVHHLDAYSALKAFLPPRERRGLTLIDPAFEVDNEFDLVAEGLAGAVRRFATGVYAVWFPIKERRPVELFYDDCRRAGFARMLALELTVFPELLPGRLNGCGMLIVNPPWQVDDDVRAVLPALRQCLGRGSGTAALTWLAGP
jgi:23S rRNA (adenine2030-N6)-methyltransferase